MLARETDPLIPSCYDAHEISAFDPSIPCSKQSKICLCWPKLGSIIISFVFVSVILTFRSEKWNQIPPFTGLEEEFDYIVVGAGPAGTIVAMNLANKLEKEARESGGQIRKVLLIESGTKSQSAVEERIKAINKGENSNTSELLNEFDIPLAWSMLSKVPQNRNDLTDFSSHQWISESINFLGRAIGGSGVHNAMINVRALPTDFDNWNITKWSHNEVMPYFNKLETFINNPPPSFLEPTMYEHQSRGTSGPLTTGTLGNLISPLAEDFILSSLSAGIPLASLGFNDADPSKRLGVGFYEFNIRGGMRDSVAEAYFRISVPSNLKILTGCTVQNAIFQSDDLDVPKAVGVAYNIDKSKQSLHAMLRLDSKIETEVIFSAGAILTPQLLANSGIQEGGSIVHSPNVGKNLMDHPAIAVSFEMTPDSAEEVLSYFFGDNVLDTFEDLVLSRMKQWVPYIDSALSTPGFSSGGFLKSPFSTQHGPDIQLTVFPHLEEPHYSLTNKRVSKSWSYMMITVALVQPETRSELILARSDGNESTTLNIQSLMDDSAPNFPMPKLKSGTLSENDTEKLVWGIEQVRKIMSSAPVVHRIKSEASPGKIFTGDGLKEYVRNNIMQNSHWSGSCRMGTDDKSVVDEYLKVRGVRNLRVIDASIMPLIPNGNTHSTTCAIALRAVDLIRQ